MKKKGIKERYLRQLEKFENKNKEKEVSFKEWKEILKQLKDKGVECDTIDFNALSKQDTTIEVLKNFIKEEYGIEFNDISVKELKNKKEEYEHLIKKELEKQEETAEQEFMKSLEKIEQEKTTDILEKIYFIPKQYTKMVARGYNNGLIIFGECGIGKSYSVLRALKEESTDFVFSSGFTTPLQLYNFLFENRKKVIVFDDISGLLNNKVCLDILKSALFSIKDVRLVEYQSKTPLLDVPQHFIFEGRIIIIANSFYDNRDLKAVADRVLFYELKLSYEQLISTIFELARQDYKDLKREERFMIAKWIKENTSQATRNINLRFLFKCYEFYRYDRAKWQDLAKESIINDERIALVNELLKKHTSVKEAEQEFVEVGNGSRRTFYRIKARLKCH